MNGAHEFKRGWPIVLASGVGIALGLSPIPFYEISLLAPELAKEFGWGMGPVMAGIFFMSLGSLLASPAVGFLADKLGARRVALTSIVCFGLFLCLFSLQRGSLPLYYANFFLMAFTGAGTLPITWTRTINQNFDIKKGLALGLALAGTGVSGFLLKPATAAVIGAFGWRGGFVFLALLPIVISLPLAWVAFRQPAGAGNLPASSAATRASALTAPGRSFGEAIRDRRFWWIGLGLLPVAFAVSGPIANMETILKGNSVDRHTIAALVPFIGLAVIVGRLGGGWLVDRIWAPAVALVLFTLSASASWLLVNGPPTAGIVFFSVIGIGLAAGLEYDLMSFLVARYFGGRSYGSIYGSMYAFFSIGAGVAPVVYGRSFDATHSFAGVVSIGAAAMFCGGVSMLFLGRYRYQPQFPQGDIRAPGAAPQVEA